MDFKNNVFRNLNKVYYKYSLTDTQISLTLLNTFHLNFTSSKHLIARYMIFSYLIIVFIYIWRKHYFNFILLQLSLCDEYILYEISLYQL